MIEVERGVVLDTGERDVTLIKAERGVAFDTCRERCCI